ncbi:MAG: hypothetical protein U0Q16_19610 [Bryobacteraceae bacterium]
MVIYRFDREAVEGFVNPGDWLGAVAAELLSPAGALTRVPYEEIKVVCFVRDFERNGWQRERRLFSSRPKTEGLWVRAIFRDDDVVEGVVPNDLLQFEPQGFLLAPPDASSNNQRLFLPKVALKDFKVMGVVGSPARPKKAKPEPGQQFRLFD